MTTLAQHLRRHHEKLSKIANASSVPEQRLHALLAGAEPTLSELRRIAAAMGVSLSELANASEDAPAISLLFRDAMRSKPGKEGSTRSSESATTLFELEPESMALGQEAGSFTATVEDFSHLIEHAAELDDGQDLNWLRPFDGIRSRTYVDAEDAAEQFRSIFLAGNHTDPLLKLPRLLDKVGLLIFIVPQISVDGASAIFNGRAFAFISPRTFPPRMLFTLAHELAHLIAHHTRVGNSAFIDRANEIGRFRQKDQRESFADAFASCLLLPKSGVGIVLKKVREVYDVPKTEALGDIELLYLSRIFGVSFQAAAKRCEDLGLLRPGGAWGLYQQLKKKHGSPERRADELELPPRPDIYFPSVPGRLITSAVTKIREGDLSIGRAASLLRIPISKIFAANAGMQ